MFWDRWSRENSINNPLWGKGHLHIWRVWLTPPPPPPSCMLKQVITLSLIECDPLFGKSQLRPRILSMFLFDKVLQAPVVKAKQSFGLILTLLCNLSKLQQDYSFIQIVAQRTQERAWESKVVTYVCLAFNPMSDQDRISPYRTNIVSTR